MRKPKIKITLVDRIGSHGCHRGHKIGDTFDYDTERGKLCPMGYDVGCPYIGRPFDDNRGLPDPTGQSDDTFRDVIRQIEENIRAL